MAKDRKERLQKIMASAGVASRRRSEEIILQGRVTVNSKVVTELGTKVDPRRDEIRVDGQRIQAESYIYIMLNKPRGVLSVMEDERGRSALGDLVSVPTRLYPVGRLDATSEGLILLTNDGALANLLTHPRYMHHKEYIVLVNGRPSEKTLQAWQRGVLLDEKLTAPAQISVIRTVQDSTLLRIEMREGRKRQIRRVAALLGHPVRDLRRVRLGPLQLGSLEVGQWRYLTPKEIGQLESLKRQDEKRSNNGRGRQRRKR
ncbi:MAG: pseudouridine synthase [Anaerolineae bacterium]|jgi:pseudouridine synthase